MALGAAVVVFVTAVTVVSVLTGAPETNGFAPTSSLVGTHVRAFSASGLNGGSVVAPWRSGHPAVLIFFASYCGPCQHEMPAVARFLRAHATSPVRVVAVDALDERAAAAAMTGRDGVTFPVVFDPNGTITTGEFGFDTVPESVFVNAKGVVTDVYYGAIPPATLAKGIAKLRAA